MILYVQIFVKMFSTLRLQYVPALITFTHNTLQSGFDVFNALDLMDNKEVLEKLKFGIGDGNLQYYLYNWKCPYMECEKVCYLYSYTHYIEMWFVRHAYKGISEAVVRSSKMPEI